MASLDPMEPFVDHPLVSLRAVQRKRLADVPDWVIDGLRHGIPPTELPLSDVGGRAERRIRELATAEMLGAHDVFERAGKAAAAAEVLAVMRQWVASAGGDAALLVDELMTTLHAELDDMPTAEEDLKPMSRMVVLLDLADRVATDGYRDPRLDAGPAPGTGGD
ncbi:MAG: hypothetical protein M3Q68_05325 [Actinomycetota bacterium]|nr:hypothetical protein [Actinomycetota bacterium]